MKKTRNPRKKAARPKDLSALAGTGRAIKGGATKGETVTNNLGPANVQKKHVAG
jgi:hypothetical protein